MKKLLLFLTVATSTLLVGATAVTYANIDDQTNVDTGGISTGWGSCTGSCAGGGVATGYSMSWPQATPSLDGSSREFFISGPSYSDALWWYKVGPNNNVSNFQFDFWLTVDINASSYAQALEFDAFQFTQGREYMFGTQCDYGQGYSKGVWEVASRGAGAWINTGISCPGFVAKDWYHITWNFHRGSNNKVYYDSLTVAHYAADGKTTIGSNTYTVNLAEPSTPLPRGWTDNMGVQFQLDTNAIGGGYYEMWVDKVTLKAW